MFRWAMGYSGVIALLAFYLGSQVSFDRTYQAPLVFIFVSGLLVASFKALMYMQQQANGLRWSYPVFFSLSWRNFLVLGLSLLFVLATFLVLLLWQGLFNAIGIDFFEYLFFRDWFLFPVLGFAFGIGVVLFRELSGVIDSISRLLQGLLRLLLPIVLLLAVCFLATLMFVGLAPLWNTNFGTALILWLMAVILFFLNAVYQDGRGDTTYSEGVHRFVSVAILTLPVLALLHTQPQPIERNQRQHR